MNIKYINDTNQRKNIIWYLSNNINMKFAEDLNNPIL